MGVSVVEQLVIFQIFTIAPGDLVGAEKGKESVWLLVLSWEGSESYGEGIGLGQQTRKSTS